MTMMMMMMIIIIIRINLARGLIHRIPKEETVPPPQVETYRPNRCLH